MPEITRPSKNRKPVLIEALLCGSRAFIRKRKNRAGICEGTCSPARSIGTAALVVRREIDNFSARMECDVAIAIRRLEMLCRLAGHRTTVSTKLQSVDNARFQA